MTSPASSRLAAAPAHAAPLTLLILAAFFSGAALRLCDGLIPRLAQDFGLTAGRAGAVVITFSIAYGVMQLLFGPLGDRYGKGRMVCLALFACALAAAASALAPGFDSLTALRAVWGVGAAGVIPLSLAWVGDSVPFEERQATLAKLLAGILGGMTAGQLAGGLFGDSRLGWRGAFALAAVGYLVVAVRLAWHVCRNPAPAGGGGPGFARQLRTVLARRWSWWVLGSALTEGVFLLGPMAYLPATLHQRFGLSLSAAAALVSLYAVGGLVYAALASQLVRRLGQVRMVLAGGLLMGLGYLGWAVSPWAWTAAPVALFMGFGTYLYHNTLQTHATQMAPEARGSAVAMFASFFFFGQAGGALLAGWALDRLGALTPMLVSAVALPLTATAFGLALRRRAQA